MPHQGSNVKHWGQDVGTTFHMCSIMQLRIQRAPLPRPKDTVESGPQTHRKPFSKTQSMFY